MNESTNLSKLITYEAYLKEIFTIIRPKRTINTLVDDITKIGKRVAEKCFDSEDDEITRQIEYDKKYNKITGGVFEGFAIIFNHIFQNDPEVGLKFCSATKSNNDFGVDAIGVNANGISCATQIKFRSNIKDLITYEDICKTYTSGQIDFNIDTNKDNSIWVFTTGTVNYIALNRFQNRLKVIDRKLIGTKINNNDSFWEEAWRLVNNLEEMK